MDPTYSIVEIGQNTEKSPGDLLSLTLQWETISLCCREKPSKENNTDRSPNLDQKTRPNNNIKIKKIKNRICKIVDFAVPADHRIKLQRCSRCILQPQPTGLCKLFEFRIVKRRLLLLLFVC